MIKATGIWWMDALAAWGVAFLVLLVLGIPAWMLASHLYWRRQDGLEQARLLRNLNPARKTAIDETGADQ